MKSAITIFNEWVIKNKDDGMQKTQTPAVMNMLQYSLSPLRIAFFLMQVAVMVGLSVILIIIQCAILQ